MPAGLQVWNSGGVLQIDSTHKNIRVKDKGTVYSANLGYGWGGSQVEITFNSNIPLLAVRCQVGLCLIRTNRSGLSCTYQFAVLGNPGQQIDYYTFDQAVGGSNYGLQVFDTSGNLVFDALDRPLRVVNVLNVIPASLPYSQAVPGGKQWAWIVSAFYGESSITSQPSQGGPGPPWDIMSIGFSLAGWITAGNVFNLSYNQIYGSMELMQPTAVSYYDSNFQTNVLLIDVTNF